ncbi:MAG TPA: outer membrane beta-barrel protein [Steroidobacteraceae bacterium]|nr:outer membrane beta-barrel protein [Steroidobacteraceae bacterium]
MKTWLACARTGARCTVALAMTAAFGTSVPASAGDLDYRLGLGMGYSDNLGRRNDALKDDENIATAGLRFAFDEDTRRLHADVTGDVTYLDYLGDTYDSELVGNVSADAAFSIIEDRFIWNVSDQWGQVAVDPFSPTSPENRENINYLSTGPDVFFGLGPQFRLGLGATYSLVDYEDEPLDSATTGGRVSLVRVLSDRSALSLNGGVRDVTYDEEALDADYQQTEAYLEYRANGARTNVLLDAGWSEVDRDAASDAQSGTLMRVNVSRRISPSTILSLTGAREFTTTAGAFAVGQSSGIGSAPTQQSASPFTNDRLSFTYDFFRHVTSLSLTANWSKQTYEDQASLDARMTALGARWRRDLSPTMFLYVSAAYSKSEFPLETRNFDSTAFGTGLSWRLSRSLSLSVRYDREQRDSEEVLNRYTENRVLLSLEYGRGEPRSTRNSPRFGIDGAAR